MWKLGTTYTNFGPQPGFQPFGQDLDLHAVFVTRDDLEAGLEQLDRLHRPEIRRGLRHDDITWIDQHLGEQVERLLRPVGDDDLALDRHRSAEHAGVLVGDPSAQFDDAIGGAVLDDPRPVLTEQSIGLATKIGEREAVGCRQPTGERQHVAHLGQLQQVADRRRAQGRRCDWRSVGHVGLRSRIDRHGSRRGVAMRGSGGTDEAIVRSPES